MKKFIPILALLAAGLAHADDLGVLRDLQAKHLDACAAAKNHWIAPATGQLVPQQARPAMLENCFDRGRPNVEVQYAKVVASASQNDKAALQDINAKFDAAVKATDEPTRSTSARASFDVAWSQFGH